MKRGIIFLFLFFILIPAGVMATDHEQAPLQVPPSGKTILPSFPLKRKTNTGGQATRGQAPLLEDAFHKVAAKVGPAVVSVTVVQTYTYGGQKYYYPFGSYDPFLDELLRDFFEKPQQFRQSGLGSGVIIDERGYILTNEHVVNSATEIEVTLSDGRKFKAELKGSDPRSDLAVIKIEADNLPVAELGDSDKAKVGEWVVAIGNPFGFVINNPQPTITVGVVSALHRSFAYSGLDEARYYGNLIQTDAAINRGNSGGPLVNLRGGVIGINALIYSTTGGYQGIGFAIPINRAKDIMEELIAGKEVKYGWLGVQVQSLTPELVALFGLPDNKGALIAEIIGNSPAEKCGLGKGDIIRKVNGKNIARSSDLVSIITTLAVGDKTDIIVLRNGKETAIPVIIGKRPRRDILTMSGNVPIQKTWRGIQVIELTPELKQRMRPVQDRGVIVSRVEPDSPGAGSGIREGDLIDEINRQEIDDIEGFQRVIDKVEGETLVHTSKGYFVVK